MQASDIAKKQFWAADAEQPLSSVLSRLDKPVLVFTEGKYSGMFQPRKILKSRIDVARQKVKTAMVHVPIVNPKASLKEIAGLMYTADVFALPVSGKLLRKEYIQVVDAASVVKIAAKEDACHALRAFELAGRKSIITLDAKTPLSTAINVLKQARIDHIPVLDGKKLAGMVNTIDILLKYMLFAPHREGGQGAHGSWKHPRKEIKINSLPISNEMEPAVVVSPDATYRQIVLAMGKGSSVILQEQGEPTGIVTLKDLLKAYAA